MSLPTRDECQMAAVGQLRRADETQNPEWAKARTNAARAWLELAALRPEFTPDDEAHWTPEEADDAT